MLLRPRRALGARHMRRVLEVADRSGYRTGEHCLAAASVLTWPFVRALDRAGYLRRPTRWTYAYCGDDVMLGAMCRALGFDFLSLTGPGGPLGVSQIGLPAPPAVLRAERRAIVHSVKNDPRWDEPSLRRLLSDDGE